MSTPFTITAPPGSNPLPSANYEDPFWHSKTPEELALAQGVQPIQDFEILLGGWPEDELDDNFEETLRRWRQEEF